MDLQPKENQHQLGVNVMRSLSITDQNISLLAATMRCLFLSLVLAFSAEPHTWVSLCFWSRRDKHQCDRLPDFTISSPLTLLTTQGGSSLHRAVDDCARLPGLFRRRTLGAVSRTNGVQYLLSAEATGHACNAPHEQTKAWPTGYQPISFASLLP